jgi:uncharacterized membrane protein YecN with MAPEG domain
MAQVIAFLVWGGIVAALMQVAMVNAAWGMESDHMGERAVGVAVYFFGMVVIIMLFQSCVGLLAGG